MKANVIWEPQEGPQTALLACPVFEVFFGGARGGGKTDAVLGEWVDHADEYGSKAHGLMVRRTLRDLEDTIRRSKEIYGQLTGTKFGEQDKTWTFPNGASIRFRYLDNDGDAAHYQGHSYTRVYVEEIGQFPSPDPIKKLMATLRSGAGVPCGFRATGNPGGPGHQWVKARYIDPNPLGWEIIREEFENPWTKAKITRERLFIPAKLSDNKYLGDEYVANLQMSGGPELVKAWLEGDWSVIEGAFFPEFSIRKHVIEPFRIPGDWYRFRSGDWGSAKPFSIGWWAVVGEEGIYGGHRLPRGSLVRYREYYGASAPNVGLKMPAEDVADHIRHLERNDPNWNGQRIRGVLDPAAFASDGGPSIAERMSKRGVWFRPADNKRVGSRGAMGGWDQVRMRLIGDGEHPTIFFFKNCVAAIRTLPALQHDSERPEDVNSDGEDHAPDEIRYACMSRPYTKSAPKTEPVRTIHDLTLDELWDKQEKKLRADRRI